MIRVLVFICSIVLSTFCPTELFCRAQYSVDMQNRGGLNFTPFSLLNFVSSKFCFTDQITGVKTELVLMDGGDAEITFYNSNGVTIRRGQANWRGTSDGPGGDVAKIYLRLSTGVSLTFRAIVDQYSSKITMLIDSRDNTWILCY